MKKKQSLLLIGTVVFSLILNISVPTQLYASGDEGEVPSVTGPVSNGGGLGEDITDSTPDFSHSTAANAGHVAIEHSQATALQVMALTGGSFESARRVNAEVNKRELFRCANSYLECRSSATDASPDSNIPNFFRRIWTMLPSGNGEQRSWSMVRDIKENIREAKLCSSQRYSDNMDLLCGCINAQKSEEALALSICSNKATGDEKYSPYGQIDPKNAAGICQEIVNRNIVKSIGGAVRSYLDSVVVGELIGVIAPDQQVKCSSDGINGRFGQGAMGGSDKRVCSAQSLAYIVGQFEKESRNCVDQLGNVYGGCALPEPLVRASKGGGPERENELQALLEKTRGLKPLAKDAKPDQARLELRDAYELYISKSPLGSGFNSFVNQSIESTLRATLNAEVPDGESMRDTLLGHPNKKAVGVKAIALYLQQNSEGNQQAQEMLKEMSIAQKGFPNIEDVISGEAELTEEQANVIIGKLSAKSGVACNTSSKAMVDQCKLLTTGLLFDNKARNDKYCSNSKDPSNELISGTLNRDEWLALAASKSDPRESARIEQAMCYQHYTNGGLGSNTVNTTACAERNPTTGLHGDLTSGADNYENLQNIFLGANGTRTSAQELNTIHEAFSKCNPFASNDDPSVNITLLDESDPLNDQSMNTAMSDLDVYSEGKDMAMMLESGVYTSSGDSKFSRNDGYQKIGGEGAKSIDETTRQKVVEREAAKNAAASFYEDFGARQMEEMQQSISTQMAKEMSKEEPAEASTSPSQDQLDLAEIERARNDRLFAELDELKRQNAELFRRLQDQGVKEIENSKGEKVSVEDAFLETNRRIDEQRRKALAEREQIDEKIAQAQEAVNRERSFASSAQSSSGSSSPSISGTPSTSQSSASSSVSRSPASSNSSSVQASSVGGSGGSSAQASNGSYGPMPYQGLILSSEELSKAKPDLNLGGRSLDESVDAVRAAIEAVNSSISLPAQFVNGKRVSEYILQEKDGKTVLVYLDGEKVVIADINLALESSTQEVAKIISVKEDKPKVEEKTPEPEVLRAPAQTGRKAWADVEAILDGVNQ